MQQNQTQPTHKNGQVSELPQNVSGQDLTGTRVLLRGAQLPLATLQFKL